MIYAGIDIGKQFHVVGAVNELGVEVLCPTRIDNNATGFSSLLEKIYFIAETYGDVMVGVEVTGHYWYTCFRYLSAHGVTCVCVNPSKTIAMRVLAGNARSKTDAVDCLAYR